MFDIIKRFFLFILPIVKSAAAQAVADELLKVADPRPRRRYTPGYTAYNRIAPRPRRQQFFDYAQKDVNLTNSLFEDKDGDFHDVLMVAFDLKGRSAADVHAWLMDNMPETGDQGDGGEINLDAWWVANDERFDGSDCDSAVFVPLGKQAEARQLLRRCGLVN